MQAKSIGYCFAILVSGILISHVGTGYAAQKMTFPNSSKSLNLELAMRKLWSDHVFWTRDYIITAVADMPDKDAAAKRLLKNQDDIGNAIVPFYGKQAGAKLTELLKQHILIAVDVVEAAKANAKQKLADADKKWHENAVEIAEFLSSANPHWSKNEWVSMLNMHLKLTTEEAVARIKKQWSADVQAFDKIYDQALGMADALSIGVIKQFPDKF